MEEPLCTACGLRPIPPGGLSCSHCVGTLGEDRNNYLCDYGGCPDVEFFCVCSLRPVWLCRRHKERHEAINPPHYVCRSEAYFGVEHYGLEHFKENLLAAISSTEEISEAQLRIGQAQESFEVERHEVVQQLARLDQYSRSLQEKWLKLEALKKTIIRNHPRKPVSSIIEEVLGTAGTKLSDKLSKFTGQFFSFDTDTAIAALELRVKLERTMSLNSGLDRLNFAVSLLRSPVSPVPPEARMCFLSDERLLVCGGAQSKAAFFVKTNMQRSHVEDMKYERDSHGVVQHSNSVYVFGGIVEISKSVRSWECLSLTTDTWEAGPMKQGRQFFNPGVFRDKIYLAGGQAEHKVEIFDPKTHTFEQLKNSVTWMLGGIVLEVNQDLLILYDKKVYRPNREPKALDQSFDVEGIGMYSIVSPIYDRNGVVHLLLSGSRKLRVAVSSDLRPNITSYPS